MAAFANHRGGLILIGVEDVHGIASSLSPLPSTAAPEFEERRLRQALLNYQAPLATCTFVWVKESAGGWFLAIPVPPSPRSPHAVLGHRGDPRQTLHYPQRHGADTTWLSEAEVAERYRRRAALQYDEERRVEQVIAEGCSALRQATGLWLYSAAVPELPVTARLDQAAVRVIEEWHRGSSSLSPLGRSLAAYGRGIPAPGRVTFTGSLGSSKQDETTIQDAYLELHLDGSAFAATPIAMRTTDEPGSREVGEITLVDDSIILVDLIARWCAHQVGAWGTATIVTGIVDANAPENLLEQSISLVNSTEGGGLHSRGTRQLTKSPRSSTIADLAEVDTVQQRLAVTYQSLTGLLHWFGLAEPLQLRPDGTIVPREFTMSRYRQVEQWATQFSVNAEVLRGDS